MPKKRYADEQIHRAGLHNVFIMGLAYIISPFFSLGIFLHMLQDSFTTVKDRDVEWFYPITRLVKRGLYDASGNKEPLDPKEKIYFYQEDSRGLVDKADSDLREYGCDPVPWRRVYGFAQNSQILDHAFFVRLNRNNISLELCSRQLCPSSKLDICFYRLLRNDTGSLRICSCFIYSWRIR